MVGIRLKRAIVIARRPSLTSTSLQPLKGIQHNLTGSKISTSSIEFVCFGPIGTFKMAALVSDWQGQFSISPLKPLNRIQRNLTGSKISTPPTKFMVFGSLAPVSDSLSHFRLLLWNPFTELKNSTGRKISTSSIKFVFFGLIRNTRWPSRPLIGWDILDFFSEVAKWNSTKLDRKQDLNVL